MARRLELFGLCSGAMLLWACGQGSVTPPKVLPQSDIETRVIAPKAPREMPRLIAPPPAYGNKIVMADGVPHALVN